MVTSEGDPPRIFHALMAGVDEYATKPITKEALAEKLGLVGLVEQDSMHRPRVLVVDDSVRRAQADALGGRGRG